MIKTLPSRYWDWEQESDDEMTKDEYDSLMAEAMEHYHDNDDADELPF